jgi:hypothetical protein
MSKPFVATYSEPDLIVPPKSKKSKSKKSVEKVIKHNITRKHTKPMPRVRVKPTVEPTVIPNRPTPRVHVKPKPRVRVKNTQVNTVTVAKINAPILKSARPKPKPRVRITEQNPILRNHNNQNTLKHPLLRGDFKTRKAKNKNNPFLGLSL